MRGVCIAVPVLVALAWANGADAGVRGDMGWSADGGAWGLCDAWILPDSTSGCRFFDRQSRVWVEIGTREALRAWRPWEAEMKPLGTLPLIPVYPMEEDEDNPGPVRLSGRLIPSDDVVEIWRLAGDVTHGERGGEWTTVFDYSPDGLWLAAGAVHVDHETSHNEFFIDVRPVSEWLALALSRLAMEKFTEGRIRAGLSSLARARRHLESGQEERQAAAPGPLHSPLDSTRYVDDDPLHSRTFVRWSTDGRTLCACESWRETTGEDKTRCSILLPPDREWRPVLVNLVYTHCPGYGNPPEPLPAPSPHHFVADGGFDGGVGAVSVYMTGGSLGNVLGAVVEKRWEEEVTGRNRYPAWFHAVGLPSPTGKWIAVGYLEERGEEGEVLHYEVEVKKTQEWLEMARSEIELHERTDPPMIDDARPALALPPEQKRKPDVGKEPGPGPSGCSVTIP